MSEGLDIRQVSAQRQQAMAARLGNILSISTHIYKDLILKDLDVFQKSGESSGQDLQGIADIALHAADTLLTRFELKYNIKQNPQPGE